MDWPTALSDHAVLRARGLFLAEGRLVLGRILAGAAGGASAIVAVLSTPAAARALDLEARVGDRLTTRSPAEMEALTGFNFHRGVLALVRRPSLADVRDVINATARAGSESRPYPTRDVAKADGRRPVLVVAEHLVDVDNVGSCFRNARAFDAACLLLDDRCPDPLYRKAVRTSLGTVLEVPWVQAPIRDLMEALATAGVITIGLTPDVGAATIAEAAAELAADTPAALVIGNEGHGLSAGTRAHCARLARIPMAQGADSLNVATALAVALYEWRVRRR
ncbi:TrmH family RNA methyltransferase [Luteitalea pratensis]|uniref:TrmH family RNA methyltransferase n=1 Tax=Luteitalea pratensis TaxID=1855912 RepID=UPI0012FF8759|nr:RNA methyltransferase [Luteitalea pratensis]